MRIWRNSIHWKKFKHEEGSTIAKRQLYGKYNVKPVQFHFDVNMFSDSNSAYKDEVSSLWGKNLKEVITANVISSENVDSWEIDNLNGRKDLTRGRFYRSNTDEALQRCIVSDEIVCAHPANWHEIDMMSHWLYPPSPPICVSPPQPSAYVLNPFQSMDVCEIADIKSVH